MGGQVTADLVRPGFYPAGGGEFTVEIAPAAKGCLGPLDLLERGETVGRRGRGIVARLPEHIAQRELKVVERKLGWSAEELSVEEARDSIGPGNIVMLEIVSEHVTEVFAAFGQKDIRAEAVARKAVDEARAYLAAGVAVGPHLADQLLIPMAMAARHGGTSRYRTVAPTRHTTTNIETIQKFIDVDVSVTRVAQDRDVWEIGVGKLED
jgi:RNA 3'-terminal phosphate cyclase (ATP)